MNALSPWSALADAKLAFLPIGATEQHGYHLPLNTDGIIAEAIANELSKRFEPSYCVPLLPYSASFEHAGFPGCISLRIHTLTAVVTDIVQSLKRSGISKIVIINGHSGNHLLRNIVQELNADDPQTVWGPFPNRRHWEQAYRSAGITETISRDMHAGEGETSLMMYLRPESVKDDKRSDCDVADRPFLETVGMKPYTESGTIGFPTRATAEKGRLLLQALTDQVAAALEDIEEIK
ncbi:creatinine amidohydrolase [Planifilum fimeticola]|uniref:Creatinine amidohydrolase n=1 Tax=Planifilum fimeticola TaxID=201975 RepID=A0A2T0LAI9_9BACL|nr:creatininase family protein [Planifilum fimeticola]PRX38849.1 creatinine amidohydrolase [Planifilum fimeticola]